MSAGQQPGHRRNSTAGRIRGPLVAVLSTIALLAAPALADEPAPSPAASGSIALSLTIPPRAGIHTASLCTEPTRDSALLRVTDASGTDLPRCSLQPRQTESETREPGVHALLVTPV